MYRFGYVFTLLFCLISNNFAKSANVTAISESVSLEFGSIAAVSGGDIDNCVASGPTIISGCTSAKFSIEGADSSGSNHNAIKVFITNAASSLSSTSDSADVEFSLSNSSILTSKIYYLPAGTGTKSIEIDLYGNLSLDNSSLQESDNYSGSYTVLACACDDSGCPTSSSDPLCN